MITKMQKYTFLVFYKEYLDFLEKLREIGVLHVIEKAEGVPQSVALRELLTYQQRIKNQLSLLAKRKVEATTENNTDPSLELLDEYDLLSTDLERLQGDIANLDKQIKILNPWGDFDWEILENLKANGSAIRFYSCSKSKYNPKWEEQYHAFKIGEQSSSALFVTVGDFKGDIENADPVHLPSSNLNELKTQKETIVAQIDEQNQKLDQFAIQNTSLLKALQSEIEEKVTFSKVVLNTNNEAENKIMILEGWVPEPQMEQIDPQLDDLGAWYEKAIPEKDENVPVLLKNNAFTKLYEMVGSLYSLPAYKEIDLTPFFAPFFMLFFGFCLGDAGYGLLMMIATIILRRKAKPNMKPVWTLGLMFGISTLIMGIIGGTFLGIPLIEKQWNWLSGLQKIMLDQNQLMIFSIILGVIQIVFGLCLKAARAIKIDGFKYALSTIGWIIILIGAGGSFMLLNQEMLAPSIANILMVVFGSLGGILVLFFNSPGKNLFLNFGLGLWDTYGTVTGLLGDILSYIRLFALGLSSAVLGSVFNMLAFDLSGDIPVVSQLITVLILLVGHSINFFMAALGSFVHPLRLTFVEFYKNTGFEGGGKKYTPFSRTK